MYVLIIQVCIIIMFFLFQALCLNKEFMHYSQCLVCFNQERDNAIEYEPETELSVPMTIKPQVFVHKDV